MPKSCIDFKRRRGRNRCTGKDRLLAARRVCSARRGLRWDVCTRGHAVVKIEPNGTKSKRVPTFSGTVCTVVKRALRTQFVVWLTTKFSRRDMRCVRITMPRETVAKFSPRRQTSAQVRAALWSFATNRERRSARVMPSQTRPPNARDAPTNPCTGKRSVSAKHHVAARR